jgi:hypothetical protein
VAGTGSKMNELCQSNTYQQKRQSKEAKGRERRQQHKESTSFRYLLDIIVNVNSDRDLS